MLRISSAEMKNFWSNYPPALLHDGNIYNFAHSSSTKDGMWIRINLVQRSLITRVLVYNRSECCQERIIGASLFIKLGDQYVKHCGDFNTAKIEYDFHCTGGGDVVEVSQEGSVEAWNLAEIRVYGTPLPSPGLNMTTIF